MEKSELEVKKSNEKIYVQDLVPINFCCIA